MNSNSQNTGGGSQRYLQDAQFLHEYYEAQSPAEDYVETSADVNPESFRAAIERENVKIVSMSADYIVDFRQQRILSDQIINEDILAA